MDAKIDPHLRSTLEHAASEGPYSVFIRLSEDLDEARAEFLRQRGVRLTRGSVLTAWVTRAQIEELADQPWIGSISGAPRARPLRPGG